MKIDLLSFNGKMEIESFLDWVKNAEIFFSYMNNKKVKLVALELNEGTSAWWDQLEVSRQRYG